MNENDDLLPDELYQRIKDEGLEKVLPRPQKGERKKAFLDRCMGSASMNAEFPDRAQRFAVCQSQSAKRPKSKK